MASKIFVKWIGTYKTVDEAGRACNEQTRIIQGRFALLNDVPEEHTEESAETYFTKPVSELPVPVGELVDDRQSQTTGDNTSKCNNASQRHRLQGCIDNVL